MDQPESTMGAPQQRVTFTATCPTCKKQKQIEVNLSGNPLVFIGKQCECGSILGLPRWAYRDAYYRLDMTELPVNPTKYWYPAHCHIRFQCPRCEVVLEMYLVINEVTDIPVFIDIKEVVG